MPMGMADVATVLFQQFMKFDAAAPDWPDRDRFVLSAGHGSMLLYALLYLLGYPGVTIDDLEEFPPARLARRRAIPNTAIRSASRRRPARSARASPPPSASPSPSGCRRRASATISSTIAPMCIAGDGCLMEGVSHEAIDLAGHLQLGRLIVLWDDNGISIDGPTTLSTSTDQLARFAAAGWHVQRVDGHDAGGDRRRRSRRRSSDARPSLIACRSVIGYGSPGKQGKETVHGAPLGETEIELARAELGWPYAPFEIPDECSPTGAPPARRGDAARGSPGSSGSPPRRKRAEFETLPDGRHRAARSPRRSRRCARNSPPRSPRSRRANPPRRRSASSMRRRSATIGGSADLTHSNFTITKGLGSVTAEDFSGRYIHYGVREHGMAAAMNGIALHGGFVPYGGTFLVFSDYARGAIRLSALMGQRVVYVLTHDSIGLGEDGPTHQPVEHLASAARHAQSLRLPPGRRDRDGGMLGDRARRADARPRC